MNISLHASASSASGALDRLDIPDDIRERIATLLADGSSLTITDEGLGPETGKGTDFITLTRSEAKVAEARPAVEKPKKVRQKPRRVYRNGIGLY